MEESGEEEDRWLADHLAEAFPQQGTIEVSSGQHDGLMMDELIEELMGE